MVDDADYPDIVCYKWSLSSNGYAVRKLRSKNVYMHQMILPTPVGIYADHLNGLRLDNRRENLREATHSQNGQRRKLQVNNKTGYRGVTPTKNGWVSQIYCSKKHITLGHYTCIETAAKAYDRAAIKYFGENAATNFPKDCL